MIPCFVCSWFGVYYSSKDYSQRNREAKAIMAFVAVFLVARLAHTATYISSLSKPRSLAWVTGVLATIVLIVIVRGGGGGGKACW